MKTIIDMAIEAEFMDAGCGSWLVPDQQKLERFVALVAEATKEKSAKVCKYYAEKCVEAENWEAEDVALHLDAAIRSMK